VLETEEDLKPRIKVLDPNLLPMVKEIYTMESSKHIFDKILQAANITLEVMYREYKSGIDPKLSVFNQSREKQLAVLSPRVRPSRSEEAEEVIVSKIQLALEDSAMFSAFEHFLKSKSSAVVATLQCLKDAYDLRRKAAKFNENYLSIAAGALVKGFEKGSKLSLAKVLSGTLCLLPFLDAAQLTFVKDSDSELTRTMATLEAALASPFDDFLKNYKPKKDAERSRDRADSKSIRRRKTRSKSPNAEDGSQDDVSVFF
jgi:hypothetical protein